MITLKLCRLTPIRLFVALALISSLLAPLAFCQETEDSQAFIAGFNAYQQKDYPAAIRKMNEVLQKYPGTPLRDMTLFWLSRAYFKNGNQQDAVRFMAQFNAEYPGNPLKNTAEDELLNLTARYERGEKLSAVAKPAKPAEAEQAEKDRLAAEQERISAAKAEEQHKAAELAEQQRQEKAAQEKLAAEKAEQERQALKAQEDRKAAELVEQQRREKAAQEKLAAEKAEQERQAALKAEEERKLAEEQQRLAQANAKREYEAARKAEEARAAEAARRAAAKHEQERLAAEKAASEAEAARVAAARKEQERIAAAKVEAERQAQQRKAEEERLAQQRKAEAKRKEQQRKAEEQRLAKQREDEERARREKAALREKAIEQYKSIIEKYPASNAATVAANKLKELGIAVALPPKAVAEPKPVKQTENAQVLRLEVTQFAGFEFKLLAAPQAFEVARRVTVPFEIINRGNGNDSFIFESGFPAEFAVFFASSAAPEQAIPQTPSLAPGETFKGLVSLIIPATSIDGLRITHPIKAVSSLMREATQSREVALTAAAPLLRAVLKADRSQPLPGERITYRLAALNVGSTAARNVSLHLDFPPQLEPVDFAAAGFRLESKAALTLDSLQLNSGENREFTIAFRLKDDSLAGQDLLCHADLINNPLKTSAAFVSNLAKVGAIHGVKVRSGSDKIVVIPGQTVTMPLTVTNTGNVREKFRISSVVKGVPEGLIYHDLNRDGIRQANEPVISEIGPLEPKEEASVVMEIKTANTTADRTEGSVQVAFKSEGDELRSASSVTGVIYSRPVLQLALSNRDGRLKPGEITSFDLAVTNNGSNLARTVELQSAWPRELELVAAEPGNSAAGNGDVIWKFKELGAGERRNIKVSFRVKPGTSVGTNIQVTNVLSYEDQLGNRY